MTTENIFSGLKVVDLASFIAGPAAAVCEGSLPMASAEPQQARLGAGSKIPRRSADSREARQMGRRAHRQYATSRAQKTEARIRGCRTVESAFDLCGCHRIRRQGA